MKLWRKADLLIPVGLLLIILLYYVNREPQYRGVPLSAWLEERAYKYDLEDADESSFPGDRCSALNRLPRKKVLSALMGFVRRRDGKVRQLLEFAAERVGLPQSQSKNANDYHGFAMTGFQCLGSNGAPAVEELGGLLRDTNYADVAYGCLCNIGPPATRVFLDGIKDGNWTLQYYSIDGLAKVVGDSSNLVAYLKPFLKHTNLNVRLQAIYAIGQRTNVPGLVMPLLLESMGEENTRLSFTAIQQIQFMGTNARIALPKLISMSEDPDPRRALFVLRTIQRIDEPSAVNIASNLLVTKKQLPRPFLSFMVGQLSRKLAPQLLGVLNGPETTMKDNLIAAASIEVGRANVRDTLQPLFADWFLWNTNSEIRMEFRRKWDWSDQIDHYFSSIPTPTPQRPGIRRRPDPFSEALLPAISVSLPPGYRTSAVEPPDTNTLESFAAELAGIPTSQLVMALMNQAYSLPPFGTPDFLTNRDAEVPLASIARIIKPTFPQLRGFIGGTNEPQAVRALLAASAANEEAMPMLLESLTNASPRVRAATAYIFAEPYCTRFPQWRERAVPLLQKLANDPDDSAQYAAKLALREISH